jgi:hypothetical protein
MRGASSAEEFEGSPESVRPATHATVSAYISSYSPARTIPNFCGSADIGQANRGDLLHRRKLSEAQNRGSDGAHSPTGDVRAGPLLHDRQQ